MIKRVVLLILLVIAIGAAAWGVLYFKNLKRIRVSAEQNGAPASNIKSVQWSDAVELVKGDRGESISGGVAVETPPELKHYSDRYWFLATQVAEITR